MSNDDLRALIDSLRRALDREAQIAEQRHKDTTERVKDVERRVSRLTTRVLLAAGAFAALVYLAGWIGPTVVREALRSLLGAP